MTLINSQWRCEHSVRGGRDSSGLTSLRKANGGRGLLGVYKKPSVATDDLLTLQQIDSQIDSHPCPCKYPW